MANYKIYQIAELHKILNLYLHYSYLYLRYLRIFAWHYFIIIQFWSLSIELKEWILTVTWYDPFHKLISTIYSHLHKYLHKCNISPIHPHGSIAFRIKSKKAHETAKDPDNNNSGRQSIEFCSSLHPIQVKCLHCGVLQRILWDRPFGIRKWFVMCKNARHFLVYYIHTFPRCGRSQVWRDPVQCVREISHKASER